MMPCFPVAAARPKRAVGIDATAVHVPADGAASTIASARARGARTDGPAISVARLNQRDSERQLSDASKRFHDAPPFHRTLTREVDPSRLDCRAETSRVRFRRLHDATHPSADCDGSVTAPLSGAHVIELRLLGGLNLRRDDGRELDSALTQPKRVALLAYLALAAPHRFHRRDTLLGLFWPELDQDHARAALRQALHGLRQALGPVTLTGRGDEEVGLDQAGGWGGARAVDAGLSG